MRHSSSPLRLEPDALIVKPSNPAPPCKLSIVAVQADRTVVLESTGEILSFDDYCRALPYMTRHICVTFSPDMWLYLLHERWSHDPEWTWRVTVQRKPHHRHRQHVSYYGFRRKDRQSFTNLVLDASSVTNDLDTDLIALGRWVREFCNSYGLHLRASAAGIASQLLRHPMFYSEARRAVPRFINSTARDHLPGPYYESYVDPAQRMTAAMYIDQQAAYHYAALTTPLPHANSTRASGLTRGNGIYARAGGDLYQREIRKYGLIHARVTVPTISAKQHKFLPRSLRTPGEHDLWIWTNELPYLESFGLRVQHLISVWGTHERDYGIVKYARWAQRVSRENPHMKALLLMPYGALGRRPETVEIHTPHGEDDLLLAGQWVEGTRSHEINVPTYTANALQLGLIQAHVRTLSLDMARQLSAHEQEVISIYADGIFIKLDDTKTIPLFAPWRLKEGNLEVHLSESLRIPVRQAVRREYLHTNTPPKE